tara:strand:- start:456 stop:1619 length:1164 start_codon:yes stop_codon:yes gene_type:complete
MTAIKKLLKILLLNAVVFFLLFVVFELSIRLISPQNLRVDPENSHVSFDFTFRPKPGFSEVVQRTERVVRWDINSRGLRDNEIAYEKPSDTFRILGLGDSFTFGFHVEQEETFLHQLELLLNQQDVLASTLGLERFQTINMGVGGHGMVAAQHMLQQEGLKYSPDMILTAVFVGNDVGESLAEFDRRESLAGASSQNGEAISWIYDSEGKPLSWRVLKFLGANLHSYVFLTTRLNMLMVRYKMVKVNEATIDILRKQQGEAMPAGWLRLQEALLAIQTTSRTLGLQNLVLIIPLRHQVDEEEWQTLSEAYQLDTESFSLDQPQQILGEFLQQQNIDYIDLLPLFRTSEQNAYYAKDPHFNALGHRITAEALNQYLLQKISSSDLPTQ